MIYAALRSTRWTNYPHPIDQHDAWTRAISRSAERRAGRSGRDAEPVASVGAVTSRPRSTATASGVAVGTAASGVRLSNAPARIRLALAVAALGAIMLAVGPLTQLVTPSVAPGFTAWPLLALLAIAPVGLAASYALSGRSSAASAVVIALALFAPGRALLDWQLIADPNLATRPELLLPTSLLELRPSAGVGFLLAGHALALLAGLIAYGNEPDAVLDGIGSGAPQDDRSAEEAAGRLGAGQGRLALALSVAGLAAVGLTGAPFHSDSPYVVPEAVFDAGFWVVLGGLLVAVAALVATGLAISAADRDAVLGGLAGAAAGVAVLVIPPIVSALVVPALHLAWGPVLALLAAACLLGVGWVIVRQPAASTDQPPVDVELPGQARLQLVGGILALVSGAAALLGGLTPLVVFAGSVAAGADTPQLGAYPGRLLLPAGAVMLLLGGALLARRIASVVRPALAVASSTVLLGGAAALDTALTALDGAPIPLPAGIQAVQVSPGSGLWATCLAMLCAVGAACCAGLAGTVERGEVDLTEVGEDRALVAPSIIAGLAAVGAFGLPVLIAPGYLPADLWTELRTASWGLLAALFAVLVAVALAPVSRSRRAVPLLLGAAIVVAVRLAELPLTAGRAAGSGAGPGFWFAAGCFAALLVGAGLAFRGVRHPKAAALTR